jgi:hypothetical protein
MKQVRFQLRDCGEARRDDGRRNNGNSGSVEFNRYAILGNFLLAISVLAEPEPSKGFQDDPRTFHCIRDADHNRGGDSVAERRTTTECPAGAG